MLQQNSTPLNIDNYSDYLTSQKSKKLNIILLLVIGILLIFCLLLVVRLKNDAYHNSQNNLTQKTQVIPTPPPTSSLEKVKATASKNENLPLINLGDSSTAVFYINENNIYRLKLDGSKADLLTTFNTKPRRIIYLPNDALAILAYDDGGKITTWKVNLQDSPPEVSPLSGFTIDDFVESYKKEKIAYLENKNNNEADILQENLLTKEKKLTGHVKYTPLQIQVCEVGTETECKKEYFPDSFIPSFNGTYLLNEPEKGGGLGNPGVVVSGDGKFVYRIDFIWYVSYALWISDNNLLTSDQKGTKLYSFKNDGLFDTSYIAKYKIEFSDSNLSKNLLAYKFSKHNTNSWTIGLFNTLTHTLSVIDEVNDYHNARFNWNKDETKLLYSNNKEMKIYDVKTQQKSQLPYLESATIY